MLPNDSMTLLVIALSLTLTHAMNLEYRLIQANNIQRQELLQQKCDKYDLDNNELYQNSSIHNLSDADLEHLLIDRKHKFLYCYVPKVSSRFISTSERPSTIHLLTTDRADSIIFECPGNVGRVYFHLGTSHS